MKVALVSSFAPGYDVGLETSYARALRARGHEVVCISSVPMPTSFRALRRLNEIQGLQGRQELLCQEVSSAEPDMVLLIKGRGVLGKTVKGWRRSGLRVFNVFPDSPFEASAAGLVGRTLLNQFRELDRLFVHDRFAVGRLRQLGIKAEFIAFARDPAVHDPSIPSETATSRDPIVFVGNPDSERIRYLRAIADLGLGIYGRWSWARLSPSDPLASCVRGEVQLGPAMVRTMRSALLSINILRLSQKTAHNMRTFEVPGCGVCCLSETSVGVTELLQPGREVVLFGSPDELRRKAIRLLQSSDTIDGIARAGWARVKDETYCHRADQVLLS